MANLFDVYNDGSLVDHTEGEKLETGETPITISGLTAYTTYDKVQVAFAGSYNKADVPSFKTNIGRNYILNSKRTLDYQVSDADTGWVDTSIPISDFSNKVFTISVKVDYDNVTALSGFKRIGMELIALETKSDGTNVTRYFGVWKYPTVYDSFHGRIYTTFDMRGVTLKSVYAPTRWGGGLYVNGVTATNVFVSNPKIEMGSKATPLIPAPEDATT